MTYFCREVEQSSRETYEQDKESNAQGRGECPPEGKFENVKFVFFQFMTIEVRFLSAISFFYYILILLSTKIIVFVK